MDKLASMAMFIRVVDCGSFAAAAESRGISATMVGKYIRAAEQRLGARLLHRTTRRQTLTDVGALYYERCKHVLAEVALAESTATELHRKPRGVLRIVAPVGFGTECLTPAIAEYLNRYPDVKVDLTLDNGRPDLLAGGFELAIQMGEVFDTSLIARPLRPYRRILAASPEYVSRHGLPSHPSDLKQHVCLGLSYWRHRDRWCLEGPGGARCEVEVDGRFTANYGGSLRQAAIGGVGIVLQPETVLAEDITAGHLLPILPDWSYVPTPIYLAYAPNHRLTAKLRTMTDFLLARFS
ncbi:MAG TPA: LysR family transcriptional regulator [Gemmatimonadaceae bacterium]|nr:LysR family transcriptional regulator [Gemmatimonadaceae bacterium]